LSLTKTYRTIVTAILLAIYVFVACPVQVWHHHSSNSTPNTTQKKHSTLSIANENGELNCGICTHKYSSFDNISFELAIQSPPIASSEHGDFIESTPIAPNLGLSNKGPPAFFLPI
jgi:hypothetical protein